MNSPRHLPPRRPPTAPGGEPRPPPGILAQAMTAASPRPRAGARHRRRKAGDGQRLPPRAHRGQARHQRLGRRQPARAVQVPLGVGQVPRRLRQPLDAAGNQHAARHRAVEEPERPDRRRAADRQAQPRLLRHRRFASPPTTSCSAPIATSPRPSAGSTCCARRSRRRSTRTPTSTSSRAWASTKRRSSTRTTRSSRSATRTNS